MWTVVLKWAGTVWSVIRGASSWVKTFGLVWLGGRLARGKAARKALRDAEKARALEDRLLTMSPADRDRWLHPPK